MCEPLAIVSPNLHDGRMSAEPAMTKRWTTVLAHLTAAIPDGAPSVIVDGHDERAALLADRLATAVRQSGRTCVRLTDAMCATHADARHGRATDTVVVADGPRWRARLPAGSWQLTIWVRTPADRHSTDNYRGDGADVVVDLHDRAWPVIRHVDWWFAAQNVWYRTEAQAFFAAKAATWDARFGDDLPAYATAVADAGLPTGGVVVDVGCGTGRALPALRDAVGRTGTVIGLDVTPEMLTVAGDRAGAASAGLVLADARQLPLADAAVDAVFAAGLLMHLPDTRAGLRELARVTRPGGRLVLFHPSGRAALAERHGRRLKPDDALAEPVLRAATDGTGWRLATYDDAVHRFFAVAARTA
jgi:SAM-dependent methyltransferase